MDKGYKQGLIAILSCNILWGFLPIYWQSLRPIDSMIIIFYRIVTMAIVCFIIGVAKIGIKDLFKPLFESKKSILIYLVAGIIITVNWSLYIWAVNANYVIQTCMGYYIEPLLICLFGIVLFKEKSNKWKKVAFGIALLGLLVMVIGYRQVPLIAIALASTFAIYAAIKKSVNINPIQSLLYETIFMAPIALIAIIYCEVNKIGTFTVVEPSKIFLLMLAGLFTAMPLGLYSFAANKLPLINVGIAGYISPSISLILGIFLFKEPFDGIQFTAFVIIWIGLVFFTYGEYVEIKNQNMEAISEGC